MQNKLLIGFMMFSVWGLCSAADVESSASPQSAREMKSGASVECASLVVLLDKKLEDVIFRATFRAWFNSNRQQQHREDHQLSSIHIDEKTKLEPVIQRSILLDAAQLSVRVVQPDTEHVVTIEQRNHTYFITSELSN